MLHGQWGRKCLKPERIYASCLTPGVTNSVWDCGRIVEDIHLDCPNISSTCLSLGNNGEIFNQGKVFTSWFFKVWLVKGFSSCFFFKVWLVKVNTPLSLSLYRVSQKKLLTVFLMAMLGDQIFELNVAKVVQSGPKWPKQSKITLKSQSGSRT